jgi:SAM-dependent methyltransferase
MGREFDELFEDVETLTRLEGESLDSILEPLGVRRVLDCACGTGIQALGLTARGYEVAASDISPRMLEILAEKAAARGLNVVTRRQDFRNLTPWPGRTFDAIVCAGGSLTLVPTDRDVSRAIHSMVGLASQNDGVVVIGHHNYAHERDAAREFYLRRPFSSKRQDLAFDIRTFGERSVSVVHNIMTMRNGRWRTSVSRKEHRYLRPEQLTALLREAGCTRVDLLNLAATQPVDDAEWILAVGVTSPCR